MIRDLSADSAQADRLKQVDGWRYVIWAPGSSVITTMARQLASDSAVLRIEAHDEVGRTLVLPC